MIVEAVGRARVAATWLEGNRQLFREYVGVPSIVGMTDDELQTWASRALDNGATLEQLRDATLFNFNNVLDIKLFIQLVNTGLGVVCNMCLNGREYIMNNACG